jgi:hypothetical protein
MNGEAFNSLGTMISAIGSPSFWRSLAEVCSRVAESSGPMIYTFSRRQHPRVLFPESRLEERDLYINSYLRAAYSTDPYYTAFLEKTPARLYTLREIAPADFYQTEYFGEYYRHTNVADEVAYLVPVADDSAIHISLTRLWSELPFSEAEIESLRALEPVIMAAVERHLEQCPLQAGDSGDEAEGSRWPSRPSVAMNSVHASVKSLNSCCGAIRPVRWPSSSLCRSTRFAIIDETSIESSTSRRTRSSSVASST